MLSGPALGAAIAAAFKEKKKRDPSLTQAVMAKHFHLSRQASISEWIKTGRVDKKHLQALFDYFSDVVGPEHWGMGPAVVAAKLDARQERFMKLLGMLSDAEQSALLDRLEAAHAALHGGALLGEFNTPSNQRQSNGK